MGIKISQLNEKQTLDDDDYIVVDDGNTTYKHKYDVVEQTYNPLSTKAQSGVAVAQAINNAIVGAIEGSY